MAAMGVEEQLNIEAYNKLKGVNTKDEKTLSGKHGIDSLVGGLISNPMFLNT